MKLLHAALLASMAATVANANPSLRAESGGLTIVRRDEAMEYMAVMTDGPFFRLEDGYDYVDNDIGNVQNNDADQCYQLCYNFAGCHAFTWTNYNGGTCWLKSGRGTVIQKAGTKSSVLMSTTYVHNCVPEAGIDYVGNDISNADVDVNVGCCQQCMNLPGCRVVTQKDGKCYFKSAKGRMVVNPLDSHGQPSMFSYDPYPASADAQCGLEQGVDFVGNDIGNAPASKASDCCAKCQSFSGCRAFSWTNQNGGTCYFKNIKGDTKANANVVSCAVLPNPAPPSCALEIGVDYVGNDIGNVPSSDAYDCCSICMAHSGCKAFSWTNQNGGTCWLKSSKGAIVANANVKSAVV